jgi:hypothetical protein
MPVERDRPVRFKRNHPALKHAGYSATTLLPGEDTAAFRKLHRDLIADFFPVGTFEKAKIAEIAHLMWRKQNLAIFRAAKRAVERYEEIKREMFPNVTTVNVTLFDSNGDLISPSEEETEQKAKEQEAKLRAAQVAKEKTRRQRYLDVEEQARRELGDLYELVAIGETATIEGLREELAIQEHLDAQINRCFKQLLNARGIKSLPSGSASVAMNALPTAIPQIVGPRKAG